MASSVKRKTGLVGMFSKISLRVNGQLVTKLKENQEYKLEQNEIVNIKVNQLYFDSPEVELAPHEEVVIKINPQALFLLFISLFFISFGQFTFPIMSLVGLISSIATIIYSIKNWFKIEKIVRK